MYNLAIRKCTAPPLLDPTLKFSNENLLHRRGSNPRPAEPEADMLPSEPTRRANFKYEISIEYYLNIF